MNKLSLTLAATMLMSVAAVAAEPPVRDLRRAVPTDVYLIVHAKNNPERDFQKPYYEEVWKTVEETKIFEKALKIVTSHMPQENLDQAKAVLQEVKDAASSIDLAAIMDCQEVVYSQVLQSADMGGRGMIVSQHLLLLRLDPDTTAKTQDGLRKLLGLVEKYSQGKAPVQTSEEGGDSIVTLSVPAPVPFRPTVIRSGDVLLVSSSEDLARRSLGMLKGGAGESKFDDPRLKELLSRLPEPEDSLVFYDGKLQFAQMRGLVDTIRQAGENDPNAARIADLLGLVFDEVSILDCQVTVEYTEGNLNRSDSLGKLLPGAEQKLVGKVLGSGKPFENWASWVPANSLSYRLTTGINLHLAYERVMEVVRERFPEAKVGLERFEQLQTQWDVQIDRDILQAFTGETASITVPAALPTMFGATDSVTAIRCEKPDRIRELLHRLVDRLKEVPAIKVQQFDLTPCAELEGFEVVSAALLANFQINPVIGFHEGWMYIGSNREAVKKVLETQAGKGATIAGTEAFTQFNLKIEGPVNSVSYTNLAESFRQAGTMLNQVGMMLPLVISMAGAQADPEALKPAQEVLGLLPSVGQIIAKFDFLEAQMSVTQSGPEPGTFLTRTVTVVRPPAAPAPQP